MKCVLRYQSPDDLDEEELRAHFPAHRAWWITFHEQGSLLLIGPFADRQEALAVFTNYEAALPATIASPSLARFLAAFTSRSRTRHRGDIRTLRQGQFGFHSATSRAGLTRREPPVDHDRGHHQGSGHGAIIRVVRGGF
jgi:uncharacterized protein YciI